MLFPLQVPLPPDANRRISPNYRFGTDMNGQREIHHGVEFENPIGTPVLAAAEGVVRFAGSDDAAQLSPWAGFYGNAVVIEHHFPGWHTPVFTLYGHLSTIAVHTGEKVAAGDVLGEVGMSGSADGPHLHFEVRLG
ncbi:MAG: M23 family metallopeptidase, partial [Anaerolineae bacterium]